jgi:hypothetical protein
MAPAGQVSDAGSGVTAPRTALLPIRAAVDTRTERVAGNKGARMACKPDSVPGLPPLTAIHLGPPLPTGSSCQPGFLGLRLPCGDIGHPITPARNPYLALLPVGLAMPVRLPVPRWALTPPFHPCPACRAVCSLWRFPSGCPGRALPGTVASWSPDFPQGLPPAAVRPSARPRHRGAKRRGQWRDQSPISAATSGGRSAGTPPSAVTMARVFDTIIPGQVSAPLPASPSASE